MRIFSSDNPNYPCIFSFTPGTSAEHYRYFTIKDGELHMEYIWQDDYLGNPDIRGATKFTLDKEMIQESKDLYNENKDIKCFDLHKTNN